MLDQVYPAFDEPLPDLPVKAKRPGKAPRVVLYPAARRTAAKVLVARLTLEVHVPADCPPEKAERLSDLLLARHGSRHLTVAVRAALDKILDVGATPTLRD